MQFASQRRGDQPRAVRIGPCVSNGSCRRCRVRPLINSARTATNINSTAKPTPCHNRRRARNHKFRHKSNRRSQVLPSGVQSTNAMGCGFHVSGTPFRPNLGQGGEETSVPICHQKLVSITPGTHGHSEHCPCSAKSGFRVRTTNLCWMTSCRIVAF